VGGLKWVKASHDSVRGKIVSEWSRQGSRFTLRVRVPVGAQATVFLPASGGAPVMEGRRPVDRAAGVKFLRREEGCAVLAVAAGEYEFKSALGGH
jgi:alpha-L-rhamnosidase